MRAGEHAVGDTPLEPPSRRPGLEDLASRDEPELLGEKCFEGWLMHRPIVPAGCTPSASAFSGG
jgi:hypothetical protein